MRKRAKIDKLKVMYVITGLAYTAGLEKCVLDLINNIDSNIFEPNLCILRQKNEEPHFKKIGVKIFELNIPPGNHVSTPFTLSRIFRAERIHIVHSGNWPTYWESVIAKLLASVPVLIHMEQGLEYSDVTQSRQRAIRKSIIQWTLSHFVDRFVAVSQEIANSLIKSSSISPTLIQKIHNAVPINSKNPIECRNHIRRELGIEPNQLIIGSVGRLSLVKNYRCLLNAIPYIIRQFPEIKVVIVGDGPELNELKDQVKKDGTERYIYFLGRRNNVQEILHCMDIFVLPSFFEGLSLSILEAMSAGLPVIATDVGGNPEVVKRNISGLLVPPNDPAALANAIITLLQDPVKRTEMGRCGKALVEEQFTLENMVRSYEKIYLSEVKREIPLEILSDRLRDIIQERTKAL